MFKKIITPSPAIFVIKRVASHLFFRGGSESANYVGDEEYFKFHDNGSEVKEPRIKNLKLTEMLRNRAKNKLTKNQRLIKDVVEHAELSRAISQNEFKNLEEMYEFMQKYKSYLRIKRCIPLGIIAPFTTTELSKMAYATAIGSKSVALTIPGFVGYSLPAFFFFHMSYFYVPDRLKPFFQTGKYTLGMPFLLVNYIVDELASAPEEKFFGQEIPIDISHTGGTVPKDIGTVEDFRKLIEELKDTTKEFTKKTY